MGLLNNAVTCSRSMTSVRGEKALNFKEAFVSTALRNWTSVLSWKTCLNFKPDKLKYLKNHFRGRNLKV